MSVEVPLKPNKTLILITSYEVPQLDVESVTQYSYVTYPSPESLIANVSNISKGSNSKVYKILEMDKDGNTKEKTIGFADGHLGLVDVK